MIRSRQKIGVFLTMALLLGSCITSCPAAEVIDQDAVVHQLDKPCKKIISLYPAHTENLVEMGGTEALIGVSASDTAHEAIDRIERFSHHDSAEKFIAADPDCVLIRPMISQSAPNLVRKLRDYGITVISLQPTSSSGLFSYWQVLGLICGRSKEAEVMTADFQARLDELRQRIAGVKPEDRPRVYFEAIHARMKTFSPESIAMFCLASAGGVNIASDAVARRQTNIAAYSKERILSHAADIDVFLAQSGRMNRITVDEIVSEPGFGAIKAIREGRVYLVAEQLVSRPTPRLIDGIRYLNSVLYQDSLQ